MAKTSLLILLTNFFFFFLTSTLAANSGSKFFYRNIPLQELGLNQEKLTHLHFYFHDSVSGPNPTAVIVAEAKKTNDTATAAFGTVRIMDDPLTVEPDPNSKQVGRAQGMYTSASQSEAGLLMVLNYLFTEGKYNGSTLSILGRNAAFSRVGEMAIVGGSGHFRFARGYAQAKTHTINETAAIVEYNVYVLHY